MIKIDFIASAAYICLALAMLLDNKLELSILFLVMSKLSMISHEIDQMKKGC